MGRSQGLRVLPVDNAAGVSCIGDEEDFSSDADAYRGSPTVLAVEATLRLHRVADVLVGVAVDIPNRCLIKHANVEDFLLAQVAAILGELLGD